MANLTGKEARQIAQGCWGAGGTQAYKTNRRGAFYYSCASHGGYVISADCLTDSERELCERYGARKETATRYTSGNNSKLMHPYRTRGLKYRLSATVTDIDFYLFEEDCQWCIPYLFCGITSSAFIDKETADRAARSTFRHWINPYSPKVLGIKILDRLRQKQCNNLIVSANRLGERVKVITAAGQCYWVEGYSAWNNAGFGNKFRIPLLSEAPGKVERAISDDIYTNEIRTTA